MSLYKMACRPFDLVNIKIVLTPFFRREENHYEPSPLTTGSLSRLPDWSCAETGASGAPTALQALQRRQSVELAKSIYEAAILVHKANNMKTEKEF